MFAVVGEQRSGTMFLGDALSSHSKVHVYGEIFLNSRTMYDNYYSFLAGEVANNPDCLYPQFFQIRSNLRKFFELLSAGVDKEVIGFHVKYDQFDYVPELLKHLNDLNVGIVHIIRENAFDIAVSQLLLAERFRQKLPAHTGRGEVEGVVKVVVPDVYELVALVERILSRINNRRSWLSKNSKLYQEVWYSDLQECPTLVCGKIFDFIGVERESPRGTLRKSIESIRNHVVNADVLDEALKLIEARGGVVNRDLVIE